MAITQISRIQHRRGLKESLPQLAAGEFGWAVDTQELFIGNGTVTDGAPEIGNTKIITEDDNILTTANTYTLRGNTNSPVVLKTLVLWVTEQLMILPPSTEQ